VSLTIRTKEFGTSDVGMQFVDGLTGRRDEDPTVNMEQKKKDDERNISNSMRRLGNGKTR
jgi:hypothetical protein